MAHYFKKIERINIEKFRHLRNVEIPIGSKITIIAGGNGTGKTSILGLLSHIFTSKSKDLNGKRMTSVFSNVFRFSQEHDIGGDHSYNVCFSGDLIKEAESRATYENKRYRFRIDVGKRTRNSGKISRPVIYLGLRRLVPLAQESTIKIGLENKINEYIKIKYQEYHNKIFAVSEDILPVHTKSFNKQTYSPTTANYDARGISAGQDNIGQIILAILSFDKLKKDDDQYNGGLLVIDELDATLYPAAQKNLLDLFLKEADKLDLQIIFTTHSTDLLTHVLKDKKTNYDKHCNVIFFDKSSGSVNCHKDLDDPEVILANLNHAIYTPPPISKTNIYFEDEEARIFFKNLIKLENGLSRKLNIQRVNLGETFYKSLLNAKFPEFNKSIIVLDGDARSEFSRQQKPKVCFLPGLKRPENIIFDFINSLDPSDDFWDGLSGYRKQVFIQNQPANLEDRKIMKTWFNSEKKYWGTGCSKLFKRWLKDNEKQASIFLNDFLNKLESIRK